MTEEYFDERERELLDYFRNNMVDPATRGTDVSGETFTAGVAQTDFVLANTLVKNVAEIITVDGADKRKGYDFTVSYGEGNSSTTVTLNVAMTGGEIVVIPYHYGSAMIEREYSRTDTVLPRIVIMFLAGDELYAGLGDRVEDGLGSYITASYRIEIRDKYASRARRLLSEMFNWARKLRHAGLYKMIEAKPLDMQNFDYDRDKEAYIWQFTLDVRWDSIFQ